MASTSKQPPKGILKKPKSIKERDADPREIAIEHAKIIQHRKDLEAEILDSLILLSEYPLVRKPPHNAANPSPSDVADFKNHVRLFQPSDYDDLIIERNVNELCGYTLCARSRRNTGPGGQWKIASNGNIMKREDFEKWCSHQCARRAMYVKVQLNETAAWERAGIPDIKIDLLDEDKSKETEVDRAARELGKLKLEEQRQAARDTAALALERGEADPSQSKSNKMNISLKEKDPKAPVTISDKPEVYDDEHLLVEGYRTKMKLDGEKKKE
ncbi:putative RNA polymerase II subunit B1 CTD phosphatase RPAP2 [Fusarium austroafricanum]|uniref:RNA polymerase II subunit B1 CTD phosphatase RPAP2 homolog n=1 Tax=Fusarium austroafricanum TaxID=2364996 RepID=A0A8H4NPQ1_9HYPO|nr:putative RNA polymerase II subunit B1 CTD phosphatase RPAP2 [Fusarium austroafricanum]